MTTTPTPVRPETVGPDQAGDAPEFGGFFDCRGQWHTFDDEED